MSAVAADAAAAAAVEAAAAADDVDDDDDDGGAASIKSRRILANPGADGSAQINNLLGSEKWAAMRILDGRENSQKHLD